MRLMFKSCLYFCMNKPFSLTQSRMKTESAVGFNYFPINRDTGVDNEVTKYTAAHVIFLRRICG